jgi:PAS domain S-box-containing protein
MRDTTRREIPPAVFADSEARFRALIERSEDLVAILDVDGTIRYASPSHAKVLGWTPADLEGRNAFALVHPDDLDDLIRAFGEGMVTPGTSVAREFRMRHQDGSWRTVEALATNRLDDPALAGAVVNARDVTARRAAERALAAKQAELEAVVYALTHDVKRPLTTITITAEQLRARLADRLTAEERDDLAAIHRLSARTEDMIRALLAFFHMDALGDAPEWIALDATVARVLDGLRTEIARKKVRVTVGALPRVLGRARQLEHVITNLLDNAVAYVECGRGTIEIRGGSGEGTAVLSVRDNGVGIPGAYHSVVFELFGRVPPELQLVDGRPVEGTGMGLAIARRLVEAHGGTVSLQSTPGAGTCVTVRLPHGLDGGGVR